MKVALLGLSGTGKTTIGNILKETYDVPVVEADDDVLQRYNGLWPDQEALIDVSFEETNHRVLEMQHVFFITSWLEKETITAFSAHGFCLLLLLAPLEELLLRRRLRDGEVQPTLLERVQNNYHAFLEIVQAPTISSLFMLTLDMSKTTTQEAISLIRNLITDQEGFIENAYEPHYPLWSSREDCSTSRAYSLSGCRPTACLRSSTWPGSSIGFGPIFPASSV